MEQLYGHSTFFTKNPPDFFSLLLHNHRALPSFAQRDECAGNLAPAKGQLCSSDACASNRWWKARRSPSLPCLNGGAHIEPFTKWRDTSPGAPVSRKGRRSKYSRQNRDVKIIPAYSKTLYTYQDSLGRQSTASLSPGITETSSQPSISGRCYKFRKKKGKATVSLSHGKRTVSVTSPYSSVSHSRLRVSKESQRSRKEKNGSTGLPSRDEQFSAKSLAVSYSIDKNLQKPSPFDGNNRKFNKMSCGYPWDTDSSTTSSLYAEILSNSAAHCVCPDEGSVRNSEGNKVKIESSECNEQDHVGVRNKLNKCVQTINIGPLLTQKASLGTYSIVVDGAAHETGDELTKREKACEASSLRTVATEWAEKEATNGTTCEVPGKVGDYKGFGKPTSESSITEDNNRKPTVPEASVLVALKPGGPSARIAHEKNNRFHYDFLKLLAFQILRVKTDLKIFTQAWINRVSSMSKGVETTRNVLMLEAARLIEAGKRQREQCWKWKLMEKSLNEQDEIALKKHVDRLEANLRSMELERSTQAEVTQANERSLEEKAEGLRRQLQKQAAQLQHLQEYKDSSVQTVDKLKEANSSLAKELSQMIKAKQLLEEELLVVKCKEKDEHEAAALRCSLEERDKLVKEQAALLENLKKSIQFLSSEVAHQEDEIKEKAKQLTERDEALVASKTLLEKRNKEAIQRMESSSETEKHHQSLIDELRNELASQSNEVDRSARLLDVKNEELTQLKCLLRSQSKSFHELENKSEDQRSTISNMQQKIEEYAEDLRMLKEQYQNDLAESQALIKTKESSIHTLQADCNQWEVKLMRMQRESEQKSAEFQQAMRASQGSDAELTSRITEIRHLKGELKHLLAEQKQKLTSLEEERDRFKKGEASKSSIINELVTQNSNLKSRIKEICLAQKAYLGFFEGESTQRALPIHSSNHSDGFSCPTSSTKSLFSTMESHQVLKSENSRGLPFLEAEIPSTKRTISCANNSAETGSKHCSSFSTLENFDQSCSGAKSAKQLKRAFAEAVEKKLPLSYPDAPTTRCLGEFYSNPEILDIPMDLKQNPQVHYANTSMSKASMLQGRDADGGNCDKYNCDITSPSPSTISSLGRLNEDEVDLLYCTGVRWKGSHFSDAMRKRGDLESQEKAQLAGKTDSSSSTAYAASSIPSSTSSWENALDTSGIALDSCYLKKNEDVMRHSSQPGAFIGKVLDNVTAGRLPHSLASPRDVSSSSLPGEQMESTECQEANLGSSLSSASLKRNEIGSEQLVQADSSCSIEQLNAKLREHPSYFALSSEVEVAHGSLVAGTSRKGECASDRMEMNNLAPESIASCPSENERERHILYALSQYCSECEIAYADIIHQTHRLACSVDRVEQIEQLESCSSVRFTASAINSIKNRWKGFVEVSNKLLQEAHAQRQKSARSVQTILACSRNLSHENLQGEVGTLTTFKEQEWTSPQSL